MNISVEEDEKMKQTGKEIATEFGLAKYDIILMGDDRAEVQPVIDRYEATIRMIAASMVRAYNSGANGRNDGYYYRGQFADMKPHWFGFISPRDDLKTVDESGATNGLHLVVAFGNEVKVGEMMVDAKLRLGSQKLGTIPVRNRFPLKWRPQPNEACPCGSGKSSSAVMAR